ncbi:DUF6951 family protein [Methanolobus sp. WCC5]|jgi:hypothetical protein|uniref:DUF6951 family protein n=1 Tax=Methanolobus sp. WCC5 TaxID=3125785 RepID=UPI003255E070
MTTTVRVNSSVCGFTHKITGTLDGKNIIIDIDTPCKKIKEMEHMEVPMMETLDIKDNYVIDKAKEAQCTPICLVPAGVLHVCRMETGMLSKSLSKKSERVSIEFDET